MTYVRKTFRWGLSVLVILHHFTTPEIKALLKYCRKLIRAYCNAAVEGEGYGASIIPFEMYEYGFVLTYNHGDEEWILEVVTFPDWGSPHCRRRPPRDEGNVERAIDVLSSLRKPDVAWLLEDIWETLKETRALGPALSRLWRQISTGGNLGSVAEMLRKRTKPRTSRQSASPIIQMFTRLAEQHAHDYVEVVQLVRAKVNSAVSFLGPLWTLPLPRTAMSFDGLWDVSLFGALPEQANG